MKQISCIIRLIVLVSILSFSGPLNAQVPILLNFQGRVIAGTTYFDGTGLFRFALVSAAGTTAFWTNDGTHPDGSQPTAAVAIPVAKGLYSVLLAACRT
jgi:hypothetical protein